MHTCWRYIQVYTILVNSGTDQVQCWMRYFFSVDRIKDDQLVKYQHAHQHASTINVKFLPYNLTLSAVYCPPRHNIKQNDFEEFLQTLGPKFVVGGGYNSKHTTFGSLLTTTKGRELFQQDPRPIGRFYNKRDKLRIHRHCT